MAKKTKNKFIGIILTAVLLLALLPLFTAAGNPPDSVKFQVIGVPAEIPGISVQGGTVTISETDSDTNVISVLGNSLLSARSSVSYYNSDRGAYGHGYYASEEFELLPGHYYLVEFTAPSGYSTGGDLPMRWMYVEPNGYIEKYSLVNDHFSGWYSYAPEDGAGYTYFAKFTPVNYFTLLKFQEDGTNVLPGSQFSVEVLAENYLENWSFSGWYPFTTSAGNSGDELQLTPNTKYRVTEVVQPAGYYNKVPFRFTFETDENGNIDPDTALMDDDTQTVYGATYESVYGTTLGNVKVDTATGSGGYHQRLSEFYIINLPLTDSLFSFSFTKTNYLSDYTPGAPITGVDEPAQFTLYMDSDCTIDVPEDDSTGFKNPVSADNDTGVVTFNGLPIVVDEVVYYLKETAAPTGYYSLGEIFTVTVNQGSAVIRNSGGDLVLSVKNNKPSEIYFTKTDLDSGRPIVGDGLSAAVFGLYRNPACTDLIWSKSADPLTGKVTFTPIERGIYYLKEISPPTGYEISEKVYTVYAEPHGGFEIWEGIARESNVLSDITNKKIPTTPPPTPPPITPSPSPTPEESPAPSDEPTAEPSVEPTPTPTPDSTPPPPTPSAQPAPPPQLIENIPPNVTLVPGDDGVWIEIGDDGTPRGEWHYDEGDGVWVFEEYTPLAPPQTGDAGVAVWLAFFAGAGTLAVAAAAIRRGMKRKD